MKKMKKILTVLLMVLMLFIVSGCSNNSQTAETENNTQNNTEENKVEETEVKSEDKVLVVYFSATGTTKAVAEKIASVTGGDIYEIVPSEIYTSEDLNWNSSSSRTTDEQNDPSARPEIASETINLDTYTTIYIGYPIWWGEEPRIMDTFVEMYDFTDKTMIPFCTSGGSGIGRSGTNLEENAGSGNWLDGKRLSSGVSESELQSWIDSLK